MQTRVRPEKVSAAYYSLTDPEGQIKSYVEQVVLGHVPGMTLDEVFASQSSIAAAVKHELDVDMAAFGYEIVNVLVTDIIPDAKVKSAMNDINAAQREQVAAAARGEAEKILVVKKAEAEAESKALQGQGIANQRRAIIEGLRGSIEDFQKALGDASAKEVMQLVLVTQYFDTLKSIGESDKTNTLLFRTRPERCNPFPSRSCNRWRGRKTSRIEVCLAASTILRARRPVIVALGAKIARSDPGLPPERNRVYLTTSTVPRSASAGGVKRERGNDFLLGDLVDPRMSSRKPRLSPQL